MGDAADAYSLAPLEKDPCPHLAFRQNSCRLDLQSRLQTVLFCPLKSPPAGIHQHQLQCYARKQPTSNGIHGHNTCCSRAIDEALLFAGPDFSVNVVGLRLSTCYGITEQVCVRVRQPDISLSRTSYRKNRYQLHNVCHP